MHARVEAAAPTPFRAGGRSLTGSEREPIRGSAEDPHQPIRAESARAVGQTRGRNDRSTQGGKPFPHIWLFPLHPQLPTLLSAGPATTGRPQP